MLVQSLGHEPPSLTGVPAAAHPNLGSVGYICPGHLAWNLVATVGWVSLANVALCSFLRWDSPQISLVCKRKRTAFTRSFIQVVPAESAESPTLEALSYPEPLRK